MKQRIRNVLDAINGTHIRI